MRPIDADAVYPWYIKAFSKEEIGDRAIDPRNPRFSMNDIKANLDNIPTLDQEPVLDKIKAEIERAVWEDVIVSLDGTDEVRIPRLEPDDVFKIIDKYKAGE